MTISFDAARQQVRYAWKRYVLPAYTSHDAPTLLAALVVANTGLDTILLAEDCLGATAAERLRRADSSFSHYEELRAARHVRDLAVHRLGYPVCRQAVVPALASYALALWEHGVDLD